MHVAVDKHFFFSSLPSLLFFRTTTTTWCFFLTRPFLHGGRTPAIGGKAVLHFRSGKRSDETMLCWSCQHRFPEASLEPAAFTSRVRQYIDKVNSLIHRTKGRTEEDDHFLHQMSLTLQELCGAVNEEIHMLGSKQGINASSQRCGRIGTQSTPPRAMTATSRHEGTMNLPPNNRAASATYKEMGGNSTARVNTVFTLSNTGGNTNTLKTHSLTFNNQVPPYLMKKMSIAYDLVSATIYSVLESLAIQCRANMGLLWLRPRSGASAELISPFVVGRDLMQHSCSAPYCALESSIPCVVATTGIAMNLLPEAGRAPDPDIADFTTATLYEVMEKSNAAQLLIPIHNRYTDREPQPSSPGAITAVVHLIGSTKHPTPFNRNNEEIASQTALLLSNIISSYYDTMSGEWANRFYIPHVLTAAAKYSGMLDMRAEEKPLDDFNSAPLLIYRTVNTNASLMDNREAMKFLFSNSLRRAAPLRPLTTMKELCRHAVNMETNWVSAVQQTTRLEHTVDSLRERLLKNDINILKERRASEVIPLPAARAKYHKHTTTAESAIPSSTSQQRNGDTSHSRLPSLNSAEMAVTLTPAKHSSAAEAEGISGTAQLATDVLKSDEVEALEGVVLRRLRTMGVSTAFMES